MTDQLTYRDDGVGRAASTQPPDSFLSVPPQVPIDLDSVPWQVVCDEDDRPTPVRFKWLIDPSTSHTCMVVQLPPNHSAPPHWHRSDTIYIVRRGELIFNGEETYSAGRARWVPGGAVSGRQSAGPDGCEYHFVSLGPYRVLDPDRVHPPTGRP